MVLGLSTALLDEDLHLCLPLQTVVSDKNKLFNVIALLLHEVAWPSVVCNSTYDMCILVERTMFAECCRGFKDSSSE